MRLLKVLQMTAVLNVGLGAWTCVEAQRLTWLGTLGGSQSEAYGAQRTARSWSGTRITPTNSRAPSDGRRGEEWKT